MEDNIANHTLCIAAFFRSLVYLQSTNSKRNEPTNEYVSKQNGLALRCYDRIKI